MQLKALLPSWSKKVFPLQIFPPLSLSIYSLLLKQIFFLSKYFPSPRIFLLQIFSFSKFLLPAFLLLRKKRFSSFSFSVFLLRQGSYFFKIQNHRKIQENSISLLGLLCQNFQGKNCLLTIIKSQLRFEITTTNFQITVEPGPAK